MSKDSKLRSVNTRFWDDSYVINLDPIEKLLFLYFLTNPLTNLAGIYEIALRRIAFDTGIDKEMVSKILERFEKDKKIYYRENYLILANFYKNQNYNPSMLTNAENYINSLPKSIISFIENLEGQPVASLLPTCGQEEEEEEGESEGEKEGKGKIDTLSLLNHWNSFAEELGLAKIKEITNKRLAHVKRRLKEPNFDFIKIIEQVKRSDFLKGKNDRGWKVDFDFIFGSTDNYLKILEGKYETNRTNNGGATAEGLAGIVKRRHERNQQGS